MTYYTTDQYKERWHTTFNDLNDVYWLVDIEDPTFTGTSTYIQASANPFEWEGSGDDDQTECVLGSTGTLRLIITDATILQSLLPTEINNRRVTVYRDGTLMWQGFLKMEEYSQDWISAPFEIELPVISGLELAASMTLPRIADIDGDIQTTADLLRYCISLLGVDVVKILTNKPYYEDFNGNMRDSSNAVTTYTTKAVHWSQAYSSPSYFYEMDNLQYTPKTIKDVLEAVLYPYGHLREVRNKWMVRLDAIGASHEYAYNLWYMDVAATYSYFIEPDTGDEHIHDIGLYEGAIPSKYEYLVMKSDDNKQTLLNAPASISFENESDGSDNIFEMSKDMIIGGIQKRDPISTYYGDGYTNYMIPIEASEINDPDSLLNFRYNAKLARLIQVKSAEEISEIEPLAFYIHGNTTGEDGKTRIRINIPRTVRTIEHYNMLKLTVTVYDANGNNTQNADKMLRFCVHSNGMNLNYTPGTFSTGKHYNWEEPEEEGNDDFHDMENLQWDSENKYYYAIFPDYRTSGDMRTLKMRIAFNAYDTAEDFYIVPNLEYIDDQELTTISVDKVTYGKINYNEIKTTTGGGGDSIDVSFKTSVADIYSISGKNCNRPWAGFCDARTYLDTGRREKLELECVSTSSYNMSLIEYVCTIWKDTNTAYIPVATGMNARDCTVKLTLISTNI